MSEPKSYWLPSGELIFVYDTQAAHYPPWIIAKRGKRGRDQFFSTAIKPLVRFNDGNLKRYKTEEEARVALKEYAEAHDLKPAY